MIRTISPPQWRVLVYLDRFWRAVGSTTLAQLRDEQRITDAEVFDLHDRNLIACTVGAKQVTDHHVLRRLVRTALVYRLRLKLTAAGLHAVADPGNQIRCILDRHPDPMPFVQLLDGTNLVYQDIADQHRAGLVVVTFEGIELDVDMAYWVSEVALTAKGREYLPY